MRIDRMLKIQNPIRHPPIQGGLGHTVHELMESPAYETAEERCAKHMRHRR